MNCNTPDFSVLHYLLEFSQIHVHCVSDAIQQSHPQSPPSPPSLNVSQHLGLFQSVRFFFLSGGQNTRALASTSVLPMNVQSCFLKSFL